jgi:methylmalonyl-CoA mutase
MDDLNFAADFPAPAREQWVALVEGVLKGADFTRKLVARTHDGIAIEPLYPKAEDAPRIARAETGRWRVSQRVDHPDPETASMLALADLEGGADALTLVTRKAPSARGFGVAVRSVEDLDRALAGVMLDLVHLRLDAGGKGRAMAALLVELAGRRGHDLGALSLDLGMDAVGAMAALGHLSVPWDEVTRRMGAVLGDLAGRGFTGRAYLADGRPYHEAGASEAQELAAVLATGVATLRALEMSGHSLEAARDALSFLLVADADEFLTVAKFRALRRLWAQVEQAAGLAPKPIRLHAETAWRMTTRRDPWVNILRTTVAAFSAGIGGADAVTVLPFTAALGLPDAFARRVARNTQLILLDEANLWRVEDPAAGAGAFEALTDELCQHAWQHFQRIESAGGIVASLEAGALQAAIAETRAARETAVAGRHDLITGTSDFPQLTEAPVAVLEASSAPLGRMTAPPPSDFAGLVTEAKNGRPLAGTLFATDAMSIEPLPSLRAAAPFERLRDAADAIGARTGSRPKVFLVLLGAPADAAASAAFAKTLFEAGGIEAVAGDGLATPEAAATAFAASGARLACLCSSDGATAREVMPLAEALRGAGARAVYLTADPARLPEQLGGTGVVSYVFAGCDALAVLNEAIEAAAY